jgi:hypothetical protein
MALPYTPERRLEADHVYFSGRSLLQPTDVGLAIRHSVIFGAEQAHLSGFFFSRSHRCHRKRLDAFSGLHTSFRRAVHVGI